MNDYFKEQEIKEAKRIERVLVYQRSLYIPAALLTMFLYKHLLSLQTLLIVAALLLITAFVYFFNSRCTTIRQQHLLGAVVLLMDTVVLSCMAVTVGSYGNIGSIVVMYLAVVEASVRFGLKGSLIMDIVCAIFIAGIWKYGSLEWGFTYTLQDYLVYIGIMCFISLMVGMVARNAKHQRRTAEKLIRDRALIEERHRMSNELHDGVLKSLQGLSLEAYALSKDAPEDIKEKSLYFAEVCQHLSRDIRASILDLRDDSQMADLSEQLSKLVAKINNQGKIKVAFKEDGECPKLPLKISHDILEIVNEALHNSIKHSGGDQASVEIAYSSDRISLKISDNGRGFSETDFNALVRQGKIGLMSMKERTESNNGTISFSGSSISITIPLSRDEMPKEDENE